MAVTATSGFSILEMALTFISLFGIGAAYIYYDKYMKIRKFSELADVMASAKNKPLGILVNRAGNMIPFVCEQDKTNSGLIESDYTLIHPDMVKPDKRSKFFKGPETLFYYLPYFFPIGFTESAAISQLAKEIRKNPRLSWIPMEATVLSLLFNGTETLYTDCRTVITNALKFGDEIPEILLDDECELLPQTMSEMPYMDLEDEEVA